MKEENKKYAELAYNLVKEAENFGSRLPGSENERKYAFENELEDKGYAVEDFLTQLVK